MRVNKGEEIRELRDEGTRGGRRNFARDRVRGLMDGVNKWGERAKTISSFGWNEMEPVRVTCSEY